jgi:excisionase family DNA binding protein
MEKPPRTEKGCPVPSEQLLTLLELADLWRISPHTVRKMVREGRLRPIRICRRLLFDPADVQKLVETARQLPRVEE